MSPARSRPTYEPNPLLAYVYRRFFDHIEVDETWVSAVREAAPTAARSSTSCATSRSSISWRSITSPSATGCRASASPTISGCGCSSRWAKGWLRALTPAEPRSTQPKSSRTSSKRAARPRSSSSGRPPCSVSTDGQIGPRRSLSEGDDLIRALFALQRSRRDAHPARAAGVRVDQVPRHAARAAWWTRCSARASGRQDPHDAAVPSQLQPRHSARGRAGRPRGVPRLAETDGRRRRRRAHPAPHLRPSAQARARAARHPRTGAQAQRPHAQRGHQERQAPGHRRAISPARGRKSARSRPRAPTACCASSRPQPEPARDQRARHRCSIRSSTASTTASRSIRRGSSGSARRPSAGRSSSCRATRATSTT